MHVSRLRLRLRHFDNQKKNLSFWLYRRVKFYFAVLQFDLACDEWRRSLIGSIRTIGTLLVLPITGYISDRWGRRVALTINAFNTGWIGLVRSFVNSYEWFLALEVIESAVGAGAYSSCYILGGCYKVRLFRVTSYL